MSQSIDFQQRHQHHSMEKDLENSARTLKTIELYTSQNGKMDKHILSYCSMVNHL